MTLILLFSNAVLTLLAAHIVRTVRWRTLLSGCDINVRNVRPLTALSIGYIFNMFLPLRFGEVVRTWLLSYSTRSKFSSVLGTVLVERLADLVVVSVLMIFFIIWNNVESSFAIWSAVLAMAIFLLFYSINRSLRMRRAIWLFAALFNEEIKTAMMHFVYVVLDLLFKRSIFKNWRFWSLSVAMWSLYSFSLMLFANFIEMPLFEVFSRVYMHSTESRSLLNLSTQEVWLLVYLTLPIPLILIYATLAGFNALAGLKGALQEAARIEHYAGSIALGRLHGFRFDEHYYSFLDRFFRGQGGLLSEFEQRGINDVRVHRVFHGGSGAITALIEVNDHLRVRKFASGPLALKLERQKDWLLQHSRELRLVKLLGSQSEHGDFFYDMAYVGGSLGFYEGIHADSLEKSIFIINEVIDAVSLFHESTRVENAGDDVVGDYVDAKVISNFRIIEKEFDDLIKLESIELNGESFNFSMLKVLSDRDWFISQLQDRRQSCIHGDLTIENIMLDASSIREFDWFLIDPNPDNGFQSPLIDLAKLMQSLHLGYEALHKMPKVSIINDRLNVGLHRSSQYEQIYTHVVAKLKKQFGVEIMKEVYLHEWINYLRLIPYQLKVSRECGLVFFACLCILIRDFDRVYPGIIKK